MKEHSKLLLMLLVMLLGMAYMVFGDDFTAMIGFPFHKGETYLQSWVYCIGEHLGLIILSLIILFEAKKYRFAFTVFLGYQVMDLLDFLLTDNSVWFSLGSLPISMNTLGITIFAMAVIKSFIDE